MESVVNKLFNKGLSLKSTILGLFSIISIFLIILLATFLIFFTQKLAFSAVDAKTETISQNIQASLNRGNQRNSNTIEMLDLMYKKDNFELFINILKTHPNLYAIYTGYEDGSFYEIINLNISKELINAYNTSVNDRWLLIKIDGNKASKREVTILDENLKITNNRVEENDYDPRNRLWYKEALTSNSAIKTKPYKFSHINSKGITFSKKIQNSKNVVSIDLLVNDFLLLFKEYIDVESMELFLLDEEKNILSTLSKNNFLFEEFDLENQNFEDLKESKLYNISNKNYIVKVIEIENYDTKNYLTLFVDYDKLITPYQNQIWILLFIFIISTLFTIPLVVYFSRIIVKPIYSLVRQSQKIKKQEFSKVSKVDSSIHEISLLSISFENMAKSIYEYQNSLEDKVAQRTKELSQKNLELERLSVTDKLTGLYNRVKLDFALNEELNRAKRYGNLFCVTLIDIDFFKKINDNFGHQVGDEVLKEASRVLEDSIRKTDILGRWGGEEFLIISPQTDIKGAFKLASNINLAIRNHTFSTYPNQLTVSIGFAIFDKTILKAEDLVSNADKALYKAKKDGRNRVVGFEDIS